MLQLTTRTCYAIRALLEIAQSDGNAPVMVRRISTNQDISHKYLHALLTSLKTAGLVRSIRGARGGFLLTRAADEMGLDEIIRAVEGSIAVKECVDNPDECSNSESCAASKLFRDISQVLADKLSEVTLQDLMTPRSAIS